jgi:2-polyprenyl-6-hydroxyphenyl methylase/3-demethylubiquinone-9 3-methyltransferase
MKRTLKWNLAQKAELRWWENYLKGKNIDEYHAWKKEYWQKLLDMISISCPVSAGMSLLDAGCGPAGIFMNLQDCKVDALDPLLDMYDAKLPHFKKANYPHVNFLSFPLEELPEQKQYDIVFCMNAINHVSELQQCYNLLAAAVKPGGKLVITIDAHNSGFFKRLFRILPGDILHPHQYDLEEYENFLTERNFKILQHEKLKKEFFFNHYMQVAEKKKITYLRT